LFIRPNGRATNAQRLDFKGLIGFNKASAAPLAME
jgi:hypothetical protein